MILCTVAVSGPAASVVSKAHKPQTRTTETCLLETPMPMTATVTVPPVIRGALAPYRITETHTEGTLATVARHIRRDPQQRTRTGGWAPHLPGLTLTRTDA